MSKSRLNAHSFVVFGCLKIQRKDFCPCKFRLSKYRLNARSFVVFDCFKFQRKDFCPRKFDFKFSHEKQMFQFT
ncbi:hypothetical protein V6O07_03305, partial [Arthrospira platensis SPKY2]